jgi:hypothetical protein
MVKKLTIVLAIGVFFVFNLPAAMVSFLVIETGLNEEDPKRQHTQQWENYLLDVFYEAGHIVCNAPIRRLEKKPSDEVPKEAKADFLEAAEVGVDYFIIAQLDYAPGSLKPNEISLKLYKMLPSPYKKIHEKHFAGKTYKTENEENDDLKKMAGDLVPFISN